MVGLAGATRISPGVIAAVIAAFATSSPELTVAIHSALSQTPQISLGDALGSNVVNVALILGISLLIAPIAVPRGIVKRDLPVALLAPVLVGALLVDGVLSRLDGAILLGTFAVWLAITIREIRAQRGAGIKALGEPRPVRALVESSVGLALLIAAGRLIVFGTTGIARDYGLSEFAIGASIVAVGTSVPELATVVISRLKGYGEIGLGTILGSNIYNTLFIIGVASGITPIRIPIEEITAALALGLTAVALAYPLRPGVVGRWRGSALLVVYIAHVLATLQPRSFW
jgi:cation:H+ antiporter